ncbi:MAG: hypothetical protein ABIN36_14005 [Ferruginibacter sp.]
MFNQVWKKYLSVISILLKRSANGEQSLTMNHTDFERASGGRKMKWSFPVVQLNNGRLINNGTKYPSIVTEMITEFQADDQISRLLREKKFEFSMTNDFKLLIRNASAMEAAGETPANETAAVETEEVISE